jgi:hypothetical protein
VEPGRKIADRFEIERLAGAGGMARVYRARDLLTGAPVALKVLLEQGAAEAERFAREAEVLAELGHPAIVRFIAHGLTPEGEPYLAIEWLEGEDLGAHLRERGLTIAESLALGGRIAAGLGAVHRRGVIHRDVKPGNLWLVGGRPEGAKILDFGVARRSDAERTLTRAGAMIGTPGYMAPEQARGERALTPSADVFSLGCVLFKCLTGRRPFEGDDVMAILLKLGIEEAPRLGDLCPDAPPALEDLLARMLARAPAERPRDGAEVALALSSIEPHGGGRAALSTMERPATGLLLLGERAAEGERTLLGRPTPFVGRERELATLEAIFDEARSEHVAQAVVITAPAGVGKSRLGLEIVRKLRARADGDAAFELWLARGDATRSGSPFGLLAPVIRRLAGALDGDPILMGEQMRRAFEDLVAAECAAGPLLVVVDDAQWGDRPSLQLIDAALRHLPDRPLMVLALARPELAERFPGLWAGRPLTEIKLSALSRKASERLVQRVLGDRVSAAAAQRIVTLAGGDAFYLEELIRAVAEGKDGALPETVLAMVQQRLDGLDPRRRRVLRAASVFGGVLWSGGVLALLGGDERAAAVTESLADLVEREILHRRPIARFPGEEEYVFRQTLVREAAYGMLTDADRRLGHRLAGAWLERVGESDPGVVAEHFERAGWSG